MLLPKKRGKSLLKTMREKTPRRGQEKAENPSIASVLMMTTRKSIGINSDLRVKSLRGKSAQSEQQHLESRGSLLPNKPLPEA